MQLDLIIRLSDNLIVRLFAQLATGFENEASAVVTRGGSQMKFVRDVAFLAAVLISGAAGAQSITDGPIKIGVMNDMSGLYSDISGRGAVVAAQMAVEDFGAAAKGMKVEIISCRPSEQARCRLQHRSHLDRRR